jgi:hypothetical protein
MKSYMLILLGFVVGILPMQAFEKIQNDTTIRFNKKVIHLEDSVGQMKVKVFDMDSIPYKPLYEGVFSDGKSYEKWTVIQEIGIQLPFMNKPSRKDHSKYYMEPHWAGIGWGFLNITDQHHKMNNIDGMSLKSESSNEFFINFIEKIMPIYRNNFGLTSGVGFNWSNYYLDMNTHLLEVNGVTDVYNAPAGINYQYSRLRVCHITIPLLLEWQPDFGKNHHFYVSGGMIGGINISSSFKVKYDDVEGNTVTKVESRGLNTNPLSLDFSGQIGYGSFSAYAKYSPFSVFQSEKGPNVRSVSVGLILNF